MQILWVYGLVILWIVGYNGTVTYYKVAIKLIYFYWKTSVKHKMGMENKRKKYMYICI